MKRRYPHDKPRRQKQRNIHTRSNERRRQEIQRETRTDTNSNFDDINEQLRIQRLKKKEQSSTFTSTSTIIESDEFVENSNVEDVKAVLGKYTYDPKRKAYFPTSAFNTGNCIDKNINDDDEEDDDQDTGSYKNNTAQSFTILPHRYIMKPHNNHVIQQHPQRPSSAMMTSYIVQLLHGTKQRNNLIATNWYGKILLNSMSILPITLPVFYLEPMIISATSYGTISTLTGTEWQHDTDDTNNNIVGSALWTRGFDILPSVYYQRQDDDNSDTHIHRSSLVQFVSYSSTRSIIHGKLFNNRNMFGFSTAATLPECFVACLQPWRQTTKLHVLDYQHQTSFAIVVPFECNDFTAIHGRCSHGFRIMIGGNQSRCSTIDLFRMEQIEDHIRCHTKSDILCIESSDQTSTIEKRTTTDDGSTSNRPDLVFFGHRNGLVQVHDMRTDDVQQIGKLRCHNHIEPKNNFDVDSVVRIQSLFRERPDQLVARGRTCWMLFDLRRMGDNSSRAAVVHSVPLSTNSHLIACKGMAIDPMQSVVIVPFQHHSSGHDQHGVNVWSLDSGCYVGQKTIPKPEAIDANRPIFRQHASNIELCSTITPAWSRSTPHAEVSSTANNATNAHDTDEDYYISTKSYGLWMRLGYPYGMQHITCNGHWICHDL